MIEPRQSAPAATPGAPSAQMRKNRRIQQLRRVLLVLTVAAVIGVVILFIVRRPDEAPPSSSSLAPTVAIEDSGDLITIGEGFERTFSEGDRPVFTARGAKFGVDRHGQVFLEEVGFTIYREDGARYEVESGRARIRPEDRSARLTEGVVIVGPDDISLTTPELIVASEATILRGRGPVEFRIGEEYTGTADGLRAAVRARRFHLTGQVEMKSTPAAASRLRLEAEHIILDRNRNLVETRDGAVLHRPGERVSAQGMSLFFSEDGHTVRTVQARQNVIAQLRTDGGLDFFGEEESGDGADSEVPGRMLVRSESLDLFLDDDGKAPRSFELIGGPEGRAVVRSVGRPGEAAYRLLAPQVTTALADGKPQRVEAEGGVLLVVQQAAPGTPAETGARRPAPPIPARTARGERAVATFDAAGALSKVELFGDVILKDAEMEATAGRGVATFAAAGGFSHVELFDDVVLQNGTMKATGQRAEFDVQKDSGELAGAPAVATTERGRMEAPRIFYTLADGLVRGSGTVRARIDEAADTALGGTPLTRGDGPVWVEATEGFFRDQPRAFLFRGDVRAWRGDDRITADLLEGDEREDRLTATGTVRTLFTSEARPGAAAGRQAPIEVTSERMDYRRSERLLVYTGKVTATQEGRILTGDEIRILLAASGGGMERLTATGSVRVTAQSRTLAGERAVYEPAARTVEVFAADGGKVTMRDGEGNVIEGARMLYAIDTDRVQVFGRGEAEPTEPGSR